MMRWSIVGLIASLAISCGGSPKNGPGRVDVGPDWHEVRFTGAALPAVRESGAPWHVTRGDNSSSVLFGLLGLAVGYPVEGFMLGSAMTSEPSAEAPAPFVVLKIEGETYQISPVGQTLAPRWQQPIAIPAGRHPDDARALVQVLDAIDQGVLGQVELSVGDLLEPGSRTLTKVGDVASLDVSVSASKGRPEVEFEIQVDPRRTPDELAGGADTSWMAIPVWNGDRLTINATGSVCPSSKSECFGPDGIPDRWQSYNYEGFADAPHGALVAILPGQVEVVGADAEFVAREAGLLLLFANDRDVGNNDGGFDVVVTVSPAGLSQ